jgi:hypothetical protein
MESERYRSECNAVSPPVVTGVIEEAAGTMENMVQQHNVFVEDREELSDAAGWLSVAFLFLAVLGLVCMWCYAWSQGLYPNPRAARIKMYGPVWGRNVLLENAYYLLALLPICAFTSALSSAILKLNVRGLAVISLSVVCFFAYMFHLPLIDDDYE